MDSGNESSSSFLRAVTSVGLVLLFVVATPWSGLRGQTCCTLQGFHTQGSAGSFSDFDGLDLTGQGKKTQFLFQVGGSDDWDSWVTGNSIINSPLLGYSVGATRWLTQSLLVSTSLDGSVFSISELLTYDGSESNVQINNFRLRASRIRSGGSRALWLQLTLPLYERYSNEEFPFRVSPVGTLELGYLANRTYMSLRGKPRLFSVKFNLRKDAKNSNLYQFNYYATGQVAWSYRIYSTVTPFVSGYLKHGSLRPVESEIYATRFPRTLFAYGLLGAGVQVQPSRMTGFVVRAYALYPVLRWSDNYLPAGFEEKPVVGVTVTQALDFNRKGQSGV